MITLRPFIATLISVVLALLPATTATSSWFTSNDIFTADDKLNWTQQTKLVAGDGLIEDHFGTAVATNGSEVLVRATGKNVTGPSSGAVYTAIPTP